jgi:putative membrane protein
VTREKIQAALLVLTALVFLWSAIFPHDRLTWVLETIPAMIAAPVIIFLWTRGLRFTTLLYVLIALHAMILMVGGHYTYAEVPLFNWIRDQFHLDRNYYDRLGHFAQGFVPALIAREILLRKTPLVRGGIVTFLCLCVAMAISAWYEILEFISAKALGDSAASFLGTQGDVWDTQWDMTVCFIGAIAAMILLPRWHDRQLAALK